MTRASLWLALALTAAPRPVAAQGSVGDGAAALPAVHRVGLADGPAPHRLAVVGTLSYGFTEDVLGEADVHHRVQADAAAAVWVLDWLAIGLGVRGRVDKHRRDDSLFGDSRLRIRASGRLGAVGLGGELEARLVGGQAPSLALDATTVSLRGLASYRAGPLIVGATLGVRFDRSARAIDDPDVFTSDDRLSLPFNDANAVLIGAGMSYRLGDNEILAELGWDLLVGADAPAPTESPVRVTLGARSWLAARRAYLSAVAEVSPSRRPAVARGEPLVEVEPRVGLAVLLGVRLGVEDAPVVAPPPPPPPPEPIALLGQVRAPDGRPIAGATVAVADLRTSTDADGAFRLPDLEPGVHEVRVTAPGRRAWAGEVTVGEGVSLTSVTLEPLGGAIRGRVLGPDGAPIAGATLTAGGQSARSAADGAFALEGVAPGPTEVAVSADGYEAAPRTVEVSEGSEVTLELRMQVHHAAQIRGQVLSFDGSPVVGATVRLADTELTATTDAEGFFAIGVPPGRYEVVLEAAGHQTQNRRVTVEDNGVTVLNVDLRRGR